jgi:hypothetical protein
MSTPFLVSLDPGICDQLLCHLTSFSITPNMIEIVVFSSFFQCKFSLPAYDFFRGLLDQYKIKLVHLNPNSILQIIIFVHLSEAFLGIPPIFPCLGTIFS